MDRTLWKQILGIVKQEARRLGGLPKVQYADWLIVAMELWHTAHDRPMGWACQKQNYPAWFRPRKLPSQSQFGRRVTTGRCQRILQAVHERTAHRDVPAVLSYFDGKPLVVGVASKDLDAKRGHVMGGFAKGYKLHIWGTQDRRIPVFSVQSLNRGEQPVAEAMAGHLPRLPDQALVLADSSYDFVGLYNALAEKNGSLLVKPRGIARHPVTRRQSGPYRREALELWRPDCLPLTRMIYRQRIHVEGILSNLTSYGGGLGPLPPWVRTLPRVRRWVGCKIILYHVRLSLRKKTP